MARINLRTMDKFIIKNRNSTQNIQGDEHCLDDRNKNDENNFTSSNKEKTDVLKSKTKMDRPSIQSLKNWQSKWSWIAYDEQKNLVFCTTCREAVELKLPLPTTRNCDVSKKTFVVNGFCTWKNATSIYNSHEICELHRNAVTLILNSKKTCIVQKLSDAKQEEMMKNRIALHKIFTSIIFLARQGLALRGHENEKSNFQQLLKLRCDDCPELKMWLGRDGHKWLHNSIVNEIIGLIAGTIRHINLETIKEGVYYALMADETCDKSKLEQVSICLRTVSDDLSVQEFFMGFFATTSTKSEALFNIIKDEVLKPSELKIENCRGQCYDGASNVSGRVTGLQARVREIEPRALFVHCSAHCLSLSMQDSLEDLTIVRNVIGSFKDLINFVLDSPKRIAEFKQLKIELQDESPFLTQFCPTRWTVRIKSLISIDNNYAASVEYFLRKSESREVDSSISAKALGIYRQLLSFEFYFILKIIIEVFEQVEILNVELQRSDLCFNESHAKVILVKQNIQSMRRNEKFDSLWRDISENALKLGIDAAVLKRARKIPKRLDNNPDIENYAPKSAEDYFRKVYFEIIDKASSSLDVRFENETMDLLNTFEKFILGTDGVDVKKITEFYNIDPEKPDINGLKLVKEREVFLQAFNNDNGFKKRQQKSTILKSSQLPRNTFRPKKPTLKDNSEILTLRNVVNYLREKKEARAIFPEYTKLIRLILTIPGSSCTNERTFSSLRRLKSYLRSTMSQSRLNDLTFIYTYSEMVQNLSVDDLMNIFIKKQNIRVQTFAITTIKQ